MYHEIMTDQTPMPFGRHKGTALAGVPAVYLLWLLNKGIAKAGLKQYILDNMRELQQEADAVQNYRNKHFKHYIR